MPWMTVDKSKHENPMEHHKVGSRVSLYPWEGGPLPLLPMHGLTHGVRKANGRMGGPFPANPVHIMIQIHAIGCNASLRSDTPGSYQAAMAVASGLALGAAPLLGFKTTSQVRSSLRFRPFWWVWDFV